MMNDCFLALLRPCSPDGEFSKEKPPVVLLVEASSWEESNANRIDGSVLASRGRLMVASVNFRLGILGNVSPISLLTVPFLVSTGLGIQKFSCLVHASGAAVPSMVPRPSSGEQALQVLGVSQ